MSDSQNLEVATLAGGCFWCTEAVFKRLKGVASVVPGYSGGSKENPTYEEVCTGRTGHAEAIQVTFDPEVLSYEKLLEAFFALHDPTTLDRQGNDVGTQYRSAIFFHDEGQRETAERVKARLQESVVYKNKIVTELVPFTGFYPAESYHRDYYDRNRYAAYCQVVIDPKVQKLYKDFKEAVREEVQS